MTTRPKDGRWLHLRGSNPHLLEAEDEAPAAVADVEAPATTSGLVRSSAVVGLGTALSRVTGLLRTIALAYALGDGLLASGYNLANTTPNIVYDLILGGVLAATLVPVFVDRLERRDDDGIHAVLTVSFVAMLTLTVAAVAAAPWIFRIYTWATGDANAEQLQRVGVPLLRFFLPQILFYGMVALVEALLNANRRFGAPAFVPILNNLLVAALLVEFARLAGSRPTVDQVLGDATLLWLLGLGTTAGIVVMGVALLPSLRSSGVGFRWRFEPRHAAVREVLSLSGWTLGYVVANQAALFVVLALAAKDASWPTHYLNAFQFFQLPYGLFAVSIMTTFTPDLSSSASRGDEVAYRARFAQGIRLMTVVVLPSAVGMAVLARPLVTALLGHGAYRSPELTADVLACFAVGLVGFALYLYAMRGFYARHDTRTPFLINLVENALNVVLALALVGRWGVQGLAFAFAAAYLVAAVLALAVLRRQVGPFGGRVLAPALARMGVAAGAMGAAVYVVSRAVGSPTGSGTVARVVAGVAAGVVVYAVMAFALRIDEARQVAVRLRLRSA